MAKVEKVRLSDVVIDMTIRTREPNLVTVNNYRQAFRIGDKFPPLVLEAKTMRLVCGFHRYAMYRAECEPDYKVECILEDYPTEFALWKRAISDNTLHGEQLDTWDKKRLAIKLRELGESKDSIASILKVTPERLEAIIRKII